MEFPKWKGSRGDWAVSRRVISYNKLKWAVFSFQPYKSPGIDGIMPIMPQQGFELLAGKLLMILRTSLALGYIPMSWRHIRVEFTPKPGKSMTQAKSLRPISLRSVILKTLKKILDRHLGWSSGCKTTTPEPICLQGRYVCRNISLPGYSQTGKVLESQGDCVRCLHGHRGGIRQHLLSGNYYRC
jgi:hypothetical protein